MSFIEHMYATTVQHYAIYITFLSYFYKKNRQHELHNILKNSTKRH